VTTHTTWVVPLDQAPPADNYGPTCEAHLDDDDGRTACSMSFGHGGKVHASHGTDAATLWSTRTG
jgi:hypothetical protein